MDNAFIRKGHGYDNPTMPGREPCTAFDGFEVIAAPLGGFDNASRESRVWQVPGASYGVTYGSHAIKLAIEAGEHGRGLFILMENGSGREVLKLATGPDWRGMRDVLLAMDERGLYAFLYSVWQTAGNARTEAQGQTAQRWVRAIADKRIRKRKGRIEIIEQWEVDMKARARAKAA